MIERYVVVKGKLSEGEENVLRKLHLGGFIERIKYKCEVDFKPGKREDGTKMNYILPVLQMKDFHLEFTPVNRLNGKNSRREMGVYVAAEHSAVIVSPRMPGKFLGHEEELLLEQREAFNRATLQEVALIESFYRKGLPVKRINALVHHVGGEVVHLDLTRHFNEGLFYMVAERGMPLSNLSDRQGRKELRKEFIESLNRIGYGYETGSEDIFRGLSQISGSNFKVVTTEPEFLVKLD